jgi:tetratricopeptide (TPR) repeat protein
LNGVVVKITALLAAFAAGQLLAEDPRVSMLIQQGDASDARRESKAALAALQQAEAIEPQNFGVVLRISKQYTDLIDAAKSKDDAKVFAEKALDYAKRAVALDANSAKAHLNLSICYGKMTDFVGNKMKMEYAKFIRDEAQRSIDLDPKDDYAWHVLGRWHSGVANLNGVLKALAGLVYGGLPPASNDEAVKCFKKAIEIAPQRMMHHAELAHAYRDAGHPDKAAQVWQNVLGIRAVDAQDEAYQKEAKLALEAAKPARGKAHGVAGR